MLSFLRQPVKFVFQYSQFVVKNKSIRNFTIVTTFSTLAQLCKKVLKFQNGSHCSGLLEFVLKTGLVQPFARSLFSYQSHCSVIITGGII